MNKRTKKLLPALRGFPAVINSGRFTARVDGAFVVFLIGMRINQPWKPHRWLPVARAMPRMLQELGRHPEMGFISAEMWFSRTICMIQYWRSTEQLLAYATNRDAEHLPAWKAFNTAAGRDGSVGVWHETYQISRGGHETIYVNMPPFGLGRAGILQPVASGRESASERLATTPNA